MRSRGSLALKGRSRGSSLLCTQGHSPFLPYRRRRRRTTHNPTAPLSRINAVLGSGVVVTAPGVTTIVSTKKSHPWVPAFGVVIVTEVIGSAGSVALREILPNPLVEVFAAILVKT